MGAGLELLIIIFIVVIVCIVVVVKVKAKASMTQKALENTSLQTSYTDIRLHPMNGLATASLVMGILAILLGGFPFGILGIIFATTAKKNGFFGGTATAGLVMSIVGLILGAILWITILVLFSNLI